MLAFSNICGHNATKRDHLPLVERLLDYAPSERKSRKQVCFFNHKTNQLIWKAFSRRFKGISCYRSSLLFGHLDKGIEPGQITLEHITSPDNQTIVYFHLTPSGNGTKIACVQTRDSKMYVVFPGITYFCYFLLCINHYTNICDL